MPRSPNRTCPDAGRRVICNCASSVLDLFPASGADGAQESPARTVRADLQLAAVTAAHDEPHVPAVDALPRTFAPQRGGGYNLPWCFQADQQALKTSLPAATG